MADEGEHKLITIPEFKVKYNDVFSLRNLYLMMRTTLLEEGWSGPDGSDDGQDFETYYSENMFQKGGHRGGKEMWVYWRVRKNFGPAGRQNWYFRNQLEIDMHMVYMENIEVVHMGKKMTAQKGEIEFFFRPYLIGDVGGKWGSHKLLKHIRHIYEDRIMRVEVEKKEKDLWREAYRIQTRIKQYLELRNFAVVPEPFHAKRFGFEGSL
ncbi:MAG TPA: hypothetical protein VJB12_02250 [Candidatus Nanoarchaeia archaeon]|nr:hypothetical protein [Candidatus Nanoarchaeia archaeon]